MLRFYNHFSIRFFLNAAAITFAALIVTGCAPQEKNLTHHDHSPVNLATPAGMIQYLSDLPSVQKVQDWQNEFAPGVTITTKHYEIHTTLLEPLLLHNIPCFMESAYLAYQKQLPKPIESQTKYKIYLFITTFY